MRTRAALFVSLAVLGLAGASAPVAEAQSFFQKIFGVGAPPNAVPVEAPRARAVIPFNRFQSRSLSRAYQSRRRIDTDPDDEIGPPDSGGPYKTMCVRACDGFYFPLRHNARRKNFANDVRSCRTACGSEARLFYYALRDGEGPETMVDLAGNKYAESQNAFAYRNKLVSGCACKPDPWSYEEARRHQSYADQQAREIADASVEADSEADAANAGSKEQNATANSDFAKAQPVAFDGSAIDVTSRLNAAVATEPSSARPNAEAARSDGIAPPRMMRRRLRGFVHRTNYRFVPSASPRAR